MKPRVWRVEDDGEARLPVSTTAEAGLVSLPFLVAAVRRRWRRVVASAGLCALLALGLVHAQGTPTSATITLQLISNPNLDPNDAMSTNLSLLHARDLSKLVVRDLDLPVTPDAFGATVTGTPLSTQLMTVTVSAPSGPEAIRWVTGLARVYLDFRAEKLSTFADSTVRANQQLIDELNAKIAALSRQYTAAAATPGQEQVAEGLFTQRVQLQTQVATAEQQNSETKLQNQALMDASHVVDSAALVGTSQLKSEVRAVMSGLIGGTALGLALVLTPAVLSRRLRRRDDVARALGIPVRFSAGRVRGRWWWLPARQHRRHAERLAHGLATALPEGTETARLTVATIGDVRDGAFVVGALADELARESIRVAVVDLSSPGALAKPSWFELGRTDPIRNRQLVQVHRHNVRVSELASRVRTRATSDTDLDKADVVLTLIELDLGAGVEALGDLADASVVLVSAGRASAERLRSSATLLRQSDIDPAFAMLAGADDTDDSSGLLARVGAQDVSTRRSS